MQEEWNKTAIFATPNEIRPKSRYSQQSVDTKAILVTETRMTTGTYWLIPASVRGG